MSDRAGTDRRTVNGTKHKAPGLFFLRAAILLVVTLLLYWIGWRSPWAIADPRVDVQVTDLPKPAVIQPAPRAESNR